MKLKLFLPFLAIGLFTITTYSQGGHHCSRVKGHNHSEQRSARLSDHHISLTERYDVHFYKLDIELERTSTYISGAVQIHVDVVAPVLDTFVFELWDDFWIDDVIMNGETAIPFSREESAVLVPVDFEAGDSFFLEIVYEGLPPTGGGPLGGGGMTNASSPSWGNQATWSLSEPFAAYEWFPCKQSLTDKADSVCVFVTTDSTNMAGSNGLLMDVVDVAPSQKRYEWKSNYPIDYYLISVAVAEYVEYTIYATPEGSEPIMIQNFIYNNPGCLPFFEDDIDETADYLEYYSELYGLYPFAAEKYGHCMAPISGGMEHQTMTTQGYFVNWLTAHELGHQWFGDNVTCGSWADIWINEGFASYSEELMYEEFYPGDELGSMLSRHDNIMGFAGGSVYVDDTLDVGRIFNGRLSYDKGAAIVHTFRFLIGDDDLFFEVLRTFQETFADGTALGTDFKAVAEDVTGMDFTAFFNEWYYGEGFPSYEIDYAYVDGQVIVVLDQSVSMPGVTPYFTNDLEIRIVGEDGLDEIVRLTGIDGESSVHTIPFAEPVENIACDPNNWIINRYFGADEDLNLLSLVNLEMEIEVYPNPTSDLLVVKNYGGDGNYTIYDANGKIVRSGKLIGTTTTIDVNTLVTGQYVLKVEGNETSFTKQ